MTATLGPVDTQLAALRQAYAGASARQLPDGTIMITVPDVELPEGWNQPATAVRFLVPVGYPMARPDCFWTDAGLRLANGGIPQNASGPQQVPHVPEPGFWFSWHLAAWNPATDSLLTYLRVIQNRLWQVR